MKELFKNFEIIKSPSFENDTMLARVEFNTANKTYFEEGLEHKIFRLGALDLYTQTKIKMFRLQDDNPAHLLPFMESRPSLRGLKYLIEGNIRLSNTIYTASIHLKNGYDSLENMMKAIDWALMRYGSNGSRRIYVDNANTYDEYYTSESYVTTDVSCLTGIHYMPNFVNLIFRASDIKNELYTDLITIADSFILPIYKQIVPINLLISTAQNINFLKEEA